MSETAVIMSSLDEKEFINNLNLCIKGKRIQQLLIIKTIYFREKISRLINSYIPYINREVWKNINEDFGCKSILLARKF